MKRAWLFLILLLLLAGCQQAPAQSQDVQPSLPAASQPEQPAAADTAGPQPVDLSGLTVEEVPLRFTRSQPEAAGFEAALSLQPTPEGAAATGFSPSERSVRWVSRDRYGVGSGSSLTLPEDEAMVASYISAAEEVYFLINTPAGQVLQLPAGERIDLADFWAGGGQGAWLVGSQDGLLILCPDGQAAAFDYDGQLLWRETYAGEIAAAMVTSAGTIRLITQWEQLAMLQEVEPSQGTLTPVGAVPEALCTLRLFAGERWGYDLLAMDSEALYGWRAGAATLYRLALLSDLGWEAGTVSDLACLSENALLACAAPGAAGAEEAGLLYLWAEAGDAAAPAEAPVIRTLEEAAAYDKSTAVVKREEELGLTMEVPEEYAWDLMCNVAPRNLFTFYNGETRAISDLDGWCWSVLAYTRADYEALQLDFDEWIDETIGPNARQLGRDENYMYLYAFPTDMRWEPSTKEAQYLHHLYGYTMLTDFMNRNGITPSPIWDSYYRKKLMGSSTVNGDFYSVEFGCGDKSQADADLLALADAVPNLCDYDEEPELTWQDAMIYRLNQAYWNADVGHSEADKKRVLNEAAPVYDSSIYYGEAGSNTTIALAALYDFTAQLRDELSLAEACRSDAWSIHVADGIWYLSWPGGVAESDPVAVYNEVVENYN